MDPSVVDAAVWRVDEAGASSWSREEVVVVRGIDEERGAELLLVADTCAFVGGFFGLREDREKDGGKDGDDRDDNEEFDEGESFFHRLGPWSAVGARLGARLSPGSLNEMICMLSFEEAICLPPERLGVGAAGLWSRNPGGRSEFGFEEALEVLFVDFWFSGGDVVEFAFFDPGFELVDEGEEVVKGVDDEEEGLVVIYFEVLVDDPFELDRVALDFGAVEAMFEFSVAGEEP